MDGMQENACFRGALLCALGPGGKNTKAEERYAPFLQGPLRLTARENGQPIIHAGQTIRRIYLLVEGGCYIFKYSAEGKSLLAGAKQQPQIFGLYESLSGKKSYAATVEAVGSCRLLELPVDWFLARLRAEEEVMWAVLQHLAGFVDETLEDRDKLAMNTRGQNLLLYCYEHCRGKDFPVTLREDKSLLAEELNMNLRTLYRQLARLRAEKLIGSDRGKITVNARQYKEIQRRLLAERDETGA
ncbi:MAG: Crp/Fnr family transcriptional regulator [Pseudoflavonifractor sp.]